MENQEIYICSKCGMQNLITNPSPGVIFVCPCGTKNRISDVPTAQSSSASNNDSTDIVALHKEDTLEEEENLQAKNQQLIDSNVSLLGNVEKLNQSISELQDENASLKKALEDARTIPGKKTKGNQQLDSLKPIAEYLNELTRTVYRINKSLGALGGVSKAVLQLKDEIASFKSLLNQKPAARSNVVFTAPTTQEPKDMSAPETVDTVEPARESSSITSRIKKKGSLKAKSERLKRLGFG